MIPCGQTEQLHIVTSPVQTCCWNPELRVGVKEEVTDLELPGRLVQHRTARHGPDLEDVLHDACEQRSRSRVFPPGRDTIRKM